MISVEASGSVQQEKEERDGKLDDFVKYIQHRKVVMLEDVAAEFNMKTIDVIDMIDRLDKDGKMSGLVDDRGKYISVTREEMEKVAKFITRKGRVSIEDVARESNKLINLNPPK
jgi:Mn-dependent DtxR family transcriptional regulator